MKNLFVAYYFSKKGENGPGTVFYEISDETVLGRNFLIGLQKHIAKEQGFDKAIITFYQLLPEDCPNETKA